MKLRTARLFTAATLTMALGFAIVPSGSASAHDPAPSDLLCETLGLCPPTMPAPSPTPQPQPSPEPIVIDVDLPILDDVVEPIVDGAESTVNHVVPVVNGTTTAVLGQPLLTGSTTIDASISPTTGVNASINSNSNVMAGDLATVALNGVDVTADANKTNGVVVVTDGNAVADLPLGGATGNSLVGSTVNLDLCGAQVVVGGSTSRRCTASAPAAGSSANSTLAAITGNLSLCGLQVVAAGSAEVICTTSGGTQTGGATDTLSPFVDIVAITDLCGVQIALLGSADARCSGRPTSIDVDGCNLGPVPCVSLVDVDAPLCGVGVGVIGSTNANCAPSTDSPVVVTDPADPADPTDPTGPSGLTGPTGASSPAGPTGPTGLDATDSGGTTADAAGNPDAASVVGHQADAGSPGGATNNGTSSRPSTDGVFGTNLPSTGIAVSSMLLIALGLMAAGVVARRARRLTPTTSSAVAGDLT